MEEVVARGEVLETVEVQVVEVIVGLKFVEGPSKVESSCVPEEVISEAATNIVSEVVGEETQVVPNVMETDILSSKLNYVFKDCFDSSTLNHLSPTPSPKPYTKHT